MNRIRVNGRITNRYERIIELSDKELQELRNGLKRAKTKENKLSMIFWEKILELLTLLTGNASTGKQS